LQSYHVDVHDDPGLGRSFLALLLCLPHRSWTVMILTRLHFFVLVLFVVVEVGVMYQLVVIFSFWWPAPLGCSLCSGLVLALLSGIWVERQKEGVELVFELRTPQRQVMEPGSLVVAVDEVVVRCVPHSALFLFLPFLPFLGRLFLPGLRPTTFF
jgi:hypothetical protein